MLSNMDAALPTPPSPGRYSFSTGPSVADLDPLQQSEARFRALAQATGQIYWVADAHGHLTDVSAWCAFTGQTPEEVVGDDWAEAVHPDDREHVLADWATAVATGQPYRREHRVRRADGHYRMMLAQAYPVRAADGTVSEWVGVDTDITQLQELQAGVQASQQEFRTFFELAAVGMAQVRLEDGRLVRVNQKLCELLGYSQEELLGRTFQELTYPPDLDTNLGLLEQMLAGEISTYTLEKRYVRKDGSLVWVNLTASFKRDQAGRPEYGIAVIEDISARKAAEEALRRLEEELRVRVQELEAIFAAMNEGLLVLGADGTILRTNPAYAALTGWPPGSALHAMSREERLQTLEIRDGQGRPMPPEQMPLSYNLRGEPITQEQICRNRNGEDRYVIVRAAPLTDVSGQVIGAVHVLHDVTEQRQLEEELRARVQELETIFASINEGLIVVGREGRIVRANPAYEALMGWPAGSALYSMSAQDRYRALHIRDVQGQLVPPDEGTMLRTLRGKPLAEEHIIRRPDGRDVYVSARGAPLTDAAGQIVGAVLVLHDMTEQRRLEQELERRLQELEAVFASITDGLIVHRADGSILRTNPAYMALVGWPPGSALHTMSREERRQALQIRDEQGQLIPLEELPLSYNLRGEPKTQEQIFRDYAGQDRYVSVRGAPLKDAAGRVIGAVEVIHDVTERRQLEQQTQEALKALLRMAELLVQHPLESEEQRSLLVGRHLAELACSLLGCPIAIIITLDPQTLEMQVMGTVGYTPEQEVRLHSIISTWTHSPPDLTDLAHLMAGETLVLDVTQPPYQELAALFEIRQAIVAPMQLGGQMIGMMVFNPSKLTQTFTEQQIALAGATAQLVGLVVERERLLREREEARTHALALQESNKKMDSFAGLVSHELFTPLASMKLSVQMIHRRLERAFSDAPAADTALRAFLETLQENFAPAERQVVRLERLVKDLLDDSRIKEGKLHLRLVQADLGVIVQEVVAEQRELTPERVIHLRLPADQPLFVQVDVDRIRQAIINYLTNALKYSAETAPVEIGVEQEAGWARVWVRDHGQGIPQEEQERVWERFHRVPGNEEQSGAAGGLGLGLYVTRMLIERHQGQVGVSSAPGQGATFWFTLPLA
jgi:PAS domain S-box-containing protein